MTPRRSFWGAISTIFAAGRHTAVWVALAAAAFAVSAARGQFPTLLPWTVEGFLAVFTFFLTFLLAWGVGLLGAALGWAAGSRRGWPEAGARAGVVGFWVGAGASVWAGMTAGWGVPAVLALFLLPPLIAWMSARVAPPEVARLGEAWRQRRDQFTRAFSQRLLVRRRAGWWPEMDLRGVTVGAAAGGFAIALVLLGALDYFEGVSLAARVRLRNEAVITPAGSVEWARYVSLLARGVPPTREQPIVLLEIDDATIARMASETSELGVQREVLTRLKRWGAARAVLPVSASAPAADDESLRPLVTRRPPLGRGGFQRLRRDAGPLERTVREWDRVLLFVLPETFRFRRRPGPGAPQDPGSPPPPPDRLAGLRGNLLGRERGPRGGSGNPPPSSADAGPRPPQRPRLGRERLPGLVDRLVRAAPAVGSAEFGVYHHVRQLPTLLPLDVHGRPSVPLWLTSRSGGGRGDPVRPEDEALIVNVFGSSPGALFTRVSTTTVLTEQPIYDRIHDKWMKPEQFFRNRIVFLDTLGQPMHDTPVGQSSTTELLAMATDNLLTANRLTPPPRAWQFSLMLVVGALVGSLSIRRSPLRVFQRFLAVVGIYSVTAVGFFIYPGIWAPIVPVVIAALLAALFVLQFVFTSDENELEEARAERMRRDQELSIGREIQTSLLPVGDVRLPAPGPQPKAVRAGSWGPGAESRLFTARHGAFEVVGWSEPSREVGGDFYDVFALDEGRLGIALGDVSGKGVPGALFMAVSMTLLQSYARLFAEPQEVLARTNEALYPRMSGGRVAGSARRPALGSGNGSLPAARPVPVIAGQRAPGTGTRLFVTVFYGVLEWERGGLCYASAGQTPPILVAPDGVARYLPARGLPLGALRSPQYTRHEVLLAPGERLILASDGFVESPVRGGGGSHPLGYDGFLKLAARGAPLDASAHASALRADFRALLADPEERDDLTLLVIRRSPD